MASSAAAFPGRLTDVAHEHSGATPLDRDPGGLVDPPRLLTLPVLRVLRQLGPDGLTRAFVTAWFLVIVVGMITVIEPRLANQTAIGTDPSNYYAAGLRLNSGHPLYRLSPGDRPVPLLAPPHSDAALLSPPLLGVV